MLCAAQGGNKKATSCGSWLGISDFCFRFGLPGLDDCCKAECEQAENDGRKYPVQAHVVQGKILHCGDLERTQDARANCAESRAAADIVICIGDNERDEDNDKRRGINDVQHWSRDRNDAVKAEIGCNGAEHTDNDDECLVGHLLAAQLGEVSCGGAGQTDGGGDAGKTHDDAEDDHAGLAEQRLNDGHNKLCAADLKAVLSRNGSAEVAQAHVNAEQQHACEDGRAGDDLELLAVGGVALGGGALEDYDAKRQRCERVHGLVAGLDAAENNVVGVRSERYLAERRCNALDYDDRKADKQQRSEDRADDIDDGRLADAQKQDDREEYYGEHNG